MKKQNGENVTYKELEKYFTCPKSHQFRSFPKWYCDRCGYSPWILLTDDEKTNMNERIALIDKRNREEFDFEFRHEKKG